MTGNDVASTAHFGSVVAVDKASSMPCACVSLLAFVVTIFTANENGRDTKCPLQRIFDAVSSVRNIMSCNLQLFLNFNKLIQN